MVNGVTSDCCPVTSGVPWGFILSPVLFNIVINNLDAELESKSSDDTTVVSLEGIEALERDLTKLERWSITNCVKFNKCWILCLGLDGATLDVCIDQRVRGWRAVLQKGTVASWSMEINMSQ